MSGPGSLPPAPPGAPTQPPPVRDGTPARILDASGALSQLSRPATVTGQIVSVNPDGGVRIHTDRGDVTLQPRNQHTPLAAGQTVDIDLSAGRPPRQAVIRAADPVTASTPAAAAPPVGGSVAPVSPGAGSDNDNPSGGSPSPAAAVTARPTAPLLAETTISELADTALAVAPPAAPQQVDVKTGDLLRLLPLPAGTPLLASADGEAAPVATAMLAMVAAVFENAVGDQRRVACCRCARDPGEIGGTHARRAATPARAARFANANAGGGRRRQDRRSVPKAIPARRPIRAAAGNRAKRLRSRLATGGRARCQPKPITGFIAIVAVEGDCRSHTASRPGARHSPQQAAGAGGDALCGGDFAVHRAADTPSTIAPPALLAGTPARAGGDNRRSHLRKQAARKQGLGR